MKKVILLLTIVLFSVPTLHSQSYQPKRVDFKVKKDWFGFKTIACGENGLITFYFKEKGNALFGKEKTLYVSLYDKDLEKVWQKSKEINTDLNAVDYKYDKKTNQVYLVFADKERRGLKFSNDTKVEIVKIKATPEKRRSSNGLMTLTKHSIAIPSENSYQNMLISNENVFLFIQETRIPFIARCCSPFSLIKNLATSTPKDYIYRLSAEKSFDNKQISLNHKGKYYTHLTSFLNDKGDVVYFADIVNVGKSGLDKQRLYVIDSESGKIKENMDLSKNIRKELRYKTAIQHKENQILYAGLYGEDDNSAQTGFLFRYFEDSKMIDEKEYGLKELTGKDNKKKFLGIFNVKDRTYMRFHDKTYQLDDKGNYMVIGEKLSKYYETYTYTDANGNMHTDRVHLGWTYNEAYLMAFDKNNKPLWGETFDMYETTVFNLSLVPRLYIKQLSEDEVTVMFGIGDQITTMQIDEAHPSDQKNISIKSQFKKSRVSNDFMPSIEHWYNDYFIASGYVSVKRGDSFLSGSDRMYYFTKIKFDN
ncbi:MAG: hypothetical protein K9I29_02950 [Bacteroidales bacterium]|nr:hypothetical protein [Bacteroidales bacterium]MCF8327227.1 hypothetical protein [Bacteroidales bacterium]